nr:beta-N-acetylglucosaminidase [Gemmatimonadota bacterium]
PLLVVSDLETGPGMRLTPGGTIFPPAMAFGAAGSTELAREAGRITGIEARAVGIHMTLGPLLDLNSNPDNPIINVRSFGEDPRAVGALASAWIEGARESDLLAAGKHFPGHGDTRVDSHVGLPTLTLDSARLDSVELVPFARVVRDGIAGMLVGHIAVPALDGPDAPPASVSPRLIGAVLREALGFEGLVITDALNMGGVTRRYSVAEASILALLAGADLLLQPPGTESVIDELVLAVESGRLPAARVNEAVRRVLATKARAGLHRNALVSTDSVRLRVGTPAHAAAAARVAQASITLARDRNDLVPLSGAARAGPVLHLTYARGGRSASTLSGALRAAGVPLQDIRLTAEMTPREMASLRERARNAALVMVSLDAAPVQYRELGIPAAVTSFVEEISAAGYPVIAISLGTPYLLRAFPSAPTYLLGWSSSASSQRAVARALLGTAPIGGRLPVTLPGLHRRGEAIRRGTR